MHCSLVHLLTEKKSLNYVLWKCIFFSQTMTTICFHCLYLETAHQVSHQILILKGEVLLAEGRGHSNLNWHGCMAGTRQLYSIQWSEREQEQKPYVVFGWECLFNKGSFFAILCSRIVLWRVNAKTLPPSLFHFTGNSRIMSFNCLFIFV